MNEKREGSLHLYVMINENKQERVNCGISKTEAMKQIKLKNREQTAEDRKIKKRRSMTSA